MIAALAIVAAIAWTYTISGAGVMAPTMHMALRRMPWSVTHAVLMFAMWWIMMIAMMLPATAPTALLFAAINRRREAPGVYVSTGIFMAGYLCVWAGFSLAATAMQWQLDALGMLSGSMALHSAWLGGAILLAAGLYQFSRIKHACLRHCQNPVRFISRHWRPGAAGAFRMGAEHGGYCVGCCWFLMALLFFGGVMNPYWIAGLTLYVAMEKLFREVRWLGYASGAVLAVGGAYVIAQTF